MKENKDDGPWIKYNHKGKYDPEASRALSEFLDFFAQKRFGSRSYMKLIYRDMNWSQEIKEYHLAKLIEYWKTGGFGYEFDNMRKELHQSLQNPQVIKMKSKLSEVTDKLLNEGIPHQEHKEREIDETVNFIEYFVTARLAYRSMDDYTEELRNSTGKKREEMTSQRILDLDTMYGINIRCQIVPLK